MMTGSATQPAEATTFTSLPPSSTPGVERLPLERNALERIAEMAATMNRHWIGSPLISPLAGLRSRLCRFSAGRVCAG
jgi:hypothetical protein